MSTSKGRAAPPENLEPFTFASTGRQVQIRKVSALLREEVRRQVRRDLDATKPPIPMVEVDYGDGKQRIPHTGHETYQRLLAAWEAEVTAEAGDRIKRIAVKRGVVAAIDQAALDQVRADLADEGVDTSAQTDLWAYVAYVCIGAYDDWTDLLKAIFERSSPSEAAIQAHIDSFRGDVPRARPVEPGARSAVQPDGVED